MYVYIQKYLGIITGNTWEMLAHFNLKLIWNVRENDRNKGLQSFPLFLIKEMRKLI